MQSDPPRDSFGQFQAGLLKEFESVERLIRFDAKLGESGLFPMTATGISTLQLNIGRVCNQECRHCHVNAGPGRSESMVRETFEACLRALKETDIPVVDITGGSPELNEHFRWFVSEVRKLGRHVIDRCNLTVVREPGQSDLIEFLAAQEVEVVASLPGLTESQTDAQRGEGVFETSISVLREFNRAGYGVENSKLQLNLMTNPVGAFLPDTQASMESHWKRVLKEKFDVSFNNLYTLTNMPIGRYLSWLRSRDLLKSYMQKLIEAYNPVAAAGVMCRSTLSVDWQGYLYDCDFNQMLGLTVDHGLPTHIEDFDPAGFAGRQIVTMLHCYGCTAGGGSSCGGATAG